MKNGIEILKIMKMNFCPKDGVEFEGKFCKECGASSDPQKNIKGKAEEAREKGWAIQTFGPQGPIYGPVCNAGASCKICGRWADPGHGNGICINCGGTS